MNVITVTLNPAFDLHFSLPVFHVGKENYVESASISAGGKSVNISRALTANGVPSKALVVLGKENAESFQAKLRQEGVDFLPFLTDGAIRENITLHEQDGRESRISLDSFSLSPKMLDHLAYELYGMIDKDTIVTLSGRLPGGIGVEEAKRFCRGIRERTPYLILDSNSFRAEDLAQIRPWLIKPNEHELQALTSLPTESEEQIASAAAALLNTGVAQVLVTLGPRGALYLGARPDTGHRVKARITVPKTEPVSTVGAGDSTIAGLIKGFYEGQPIEQCLKTAMAFGSAACLRPGTAPPLPADVATIRNEVKVTLTV